MFKYTLQDGDKTYVIQYLRDTGRILVCEDGSHPREGLDIAADDDRGKSLSAKSLCDIKWRLDNDPRFMTTLGFS